MKTIAIDQINWPIAEQGDFNTHDGGEVFTVMEDENGDVYFAYGHVPREAFFAEVTRYIRHMIPSGDFEDPADGWFQRTIQLGRVHGGNAARVSADRGAHLMKVTVSVALDDDPKIERTFDVQSSDNPRYWSHGIQEGVDAATTSIRKMVETEFGTSYGKGRHVVRAANSAT